MLGVLLPKLNIWMTRKKGNDNNKNFEQKPQQNITFKSGFVSMEEFAKGTK